MLLVFVGIAAAVPYSLDEALQQARRSNLELEQRRHGLAIVHYQLQSARAGFDPALSVSYRANLSNNPSNSATDGVDILQTSSSGWSVGLSQALPTGGGVSVNASESQSRSNSGNTVFDQGYLSSSVGLSVNQPLLRGLGDGALTALRDARLTEAAEEIRWRTSLEQAVIELAGAYWGVVSDRESAGISDRGVELAEQQLAETLERQEAGFAGSGDVLQVQISLGQARRSAANIRAAVGASELRLARLMGIPLAESSSLELTEQPSLPDVLPTLERMLEQADQGNGNLALARIALERSRRSARRAMRQALPNLSMDGSVGWTSGGDKTNAGQIRSELFRQDRLSMGAGLSVSLPLIPRRAFAEVGIAKLQLDQAELAMKAAELDTVLEVNAASRRLNRDAGGLVSAQETLGFVIASLAAQREMLSEGRGSTRNVVDALEALRSAELSELNAKIALQNSILRAEQVTGMLLTPAEWSPQ